LTVTFCVRNVLGVAESGGTQGREAGRPAPDDPLHNEASTEAGESRLALAEVAASWVGVDDSESDLTGEEQSGKLDELPRSGRPRGPSDGALLILENSTVCQKSTI